MKYKAIIFDLDGVLVHTDQFHYLAWKALADQFHCDFDEKVNNRLRGVSRMESLKIVFESYTGPQLSEEEMQRLAAEKNELYRQKLWGLTPLDVPPDVRKTLVTLRKEGFRLAIGSSSKNAPLILEKTNLTAMFDVISDGNNILHSKPDPEVFLYAAKMLNIPPQDCLVVEDALAGIQAASAAGMDSAAVGDAALKRCATYNLSDFAQLLQVTGIQ